MSFSSYCCVSLLTHILAEAKAEIPSVLLVCPNDDDLFLSWQHREEVIAVIGSVNGFVVQVSQEKLAEEGNLPTAVPQCHFPFILPILFGKAASHNCGSRFRQVCEGFEPACARTGQGALALILVARAPIQVATHDFSLRISQFDVR